jgi:hypothetical protein
MQHFGSIMQQNDLFVKEMGCYNQCKFRDSGMLKHTKTRRLFRVFLASTGARILKKYFGFHCCSVARFRDGDDPGVDLVPYLQEAVYGRQRADRHQGASADKVKE